MKFVEYKRQLWNHCFFFGIAYQGEKVTIKVNGEISNSRYQELNNIGKTISTRELQDLVGRNLIKQVGKAGRKIKYILYHRIGH